MTAKRQYRILGAAMMAAALVLGMTACSGEESAIEEKPVAQQPAQTATVIHVSVGAGISDGDATTRSTVEETTYEEGGKTKTRRTLQFSAGDRLYIVRELGGNLRLAGELTMAGSPTNEGASATFEGELKVYDGQGAATGYDFGATDPLAESTATLLHKDMTAGLITQNADRSLAYHPEVLAAAADVATLMTSGLLVQGGYTAGTGYSLSTSSMAQPILNCTIAGLEAGVSYKVDYIYGATAAMDGGTKTLAASMTATAGTLAFAFIAETGDKFHGIRLTNTAEPTDTYDATIGQKAFASKVYNAARTAVGKKTPLTMEALEPGSIVVQSPKSGMKYKINNLAPVTLGTNDATFYVAKGDKVQFYGNGTSITKYLYTYITGGTATVKVYGNIMSLVDETGFATATTLDSDYAFTALFATNAKLTDASGLLLPATTLNTACYAQMFAGCTSLTAAPELPAETLASYCYQQMFINCRSLTTAPALDATTLTLQCYEEMFSGCTSLTTAPVLPAETLARRSYWRMFYGCTKLSAVKCLATNISATDCTSNWLSGVAATGTFTKASTMTTWPSGIDGIPEGWTVVDKQ